MHGFGRCNREAGAEAGRCCINLGFSPKLCSPMSALTQYLLVHFELLTYYFAAVFPLCSRASYPYPCLFMYILIKKKKELSDKLVVKVSMTNRRLISTFSPLLSLLDFCLFNLSISRSSPMNWDSQLCQDNHNINYLSSS